MIQIILDYYSDLYITFAEMDGKNIYAHYGLNGLSHCEGGNCASQIVQLVIASLIIIWVVYEFVLQIKVHMRLNFSWQQVMILQILLCLAFNICFVAWSDIILWYVLQCLLYQFYFTTLVYYIGKKYLEKTVDEQHPILIIYALFCFGELAIFIYMVNSGLGHCKQIAEIIVNAVMISLSVLFFVLAYQHQRQQLRKFQEFHASNMAKTPMKAIWIWVLANIFGQIVSQIESGLIYGYYGGQQCYPVEEGLEVQILSPIFMVLTFGVPFCSTLWFYSQRRKQSEQRAQMSLTQLQLAGTQADVQNRIQIIASSTQRGNTGTVSLAQSLL